MKWEYKFVPLGDRTTDTTSALNELGAEGWEVINLVHGVAEINHAWLKRVVEEDPAEEDETTDDEVSDEQSEQPEETKKP